MPACLLASLNFSRISFMTSSIAPAIPSKAVSIAATAADAQLDQEGAYSELTESRVYGFVKSSIKLQPAAWMQCLISARSCSL